MCMMNPQEPPDVTVEEEEETAFSGKGITNKNPLFKANKPKKSMAIRKSMRINKPAPAY